MAGDWETVDGIFFFTILSYYTHFSKKGKMYFLYARIFFSPGHFLRIVCNLVANIDIYP